MRLLVALLLFSTIGFALSPLEYSKLKEVTILVDKVEYVKNDNSIVQEKCPSIAINMRDFYRTGNALVARFKPQAGTFKEMRLFSSKAYIKTHAGKQVKLQLPKGPISLKGAFTVSPNLFYTQELEMDLAKDLSFSKQFGYSYTPNIKIVKSEAMNGMYYKIDYRHGKESMTMKLKKGGQLEAIHQEKPEVIIGGTYMYDKQAHTITLDAKTLTCPDCNFFTRVALKVVPKPDPFVYEVMDYNKNHIVIKELGKYILDLHKTNEYKIFYRP